MARKKSTNKAGCQRVCGECALGRWSRKHINRGQDGQPILKLCIHATWSRNAEGHPVTLRSTQACEHFKEGGTI